MIFKTYLESPLGLLEITGDKQGINSVYFENKFEKPDNLSLSCQGCPDPLLECRRQLREYFEGWRKTFDLPFILNGTDFQKKVWTELSKIPYGITTSYSDLASRIDEPLAVRAVAGAVAKNKINIILPCHRVIGAHGHLTGYGGELWRKKWLLEFENPNAQLELF
jgi:methylated-DNA-[protein]-cysteine S-methyltransferase